MRALVIDAAGRLRLGEVPEPESDGEVVRVRACGLCGSDVEKIGRATPGTVLGHEVVAELADGRRVALVHHSPCGECASCRAGHESTCVEFGRATIVPGGFAERVVARGGYVELPRGVDDVTGSYAEPLACVVRGAERVPRGEVLIVGGGFIGQVFARVLRRRGDRVHVYDVDPARGATEPPGTVAAAVLCAPGGADVAVEAVEPGGVVLVFADAGPLPLGAVYRRELTVVGSRSATPRHLEEAVRLLAEIDFPAATVLPLERFEEGLTAYRSRRATKVVFTP